MENIKYWRKREEENRQRNIREEKKLAGKLTEVYERVFFDIKKEIEAFYIRYAIKNSLTMAEVKRKVSTLDIKEYSKKAKEYVKNKDFSKRANEEMAIYNLTMKINRLEMLKSTIGLHLVNAFDDLEKIYDISLNEKATKEFERQAGILGASVNNVNERVKEIVNSSYHNATFSDRIWQHESVLRNELNNILTNALIQGKNPRDFVSDVVKRFNVSQSQAERLLYTEMARVQIGAQEKSYVSNGYKKYIFLAESTACPICKALDEKVFLISKMLSGENAPPMHPYCRCSTAAYMDREETFIDEFYISNEDFKILKKHFDVLSNKIILNEDRKKHIVKRHPEIKTKLIETIENTIKNNEIILIDYKNDSTIMLLNIDNINVIVKLSNNDKYENSIITAFKVSDKRKQRYIQKNEVIKNALQ